MGGEGEDRIRAGASVHRIGVICLYRCRFGPSSVRGKIYSLSFVFIKPSITFAAMSKDATPEHSASASSASSVVALVEDTGPRALLKLAEETQKAAYSKLNQKIGETALVLDYEQTLDVQNSAKKHRKCIESLWASRRTVAEALVAYQDSNVGCPLMDPAQQYFMLKEAAAQADKSVREAKKACRGASSGD